MSEQQQEQQPTQEEKVSSAKMLLSMGSIGLLAGILIVFTFQFTLPYINANEAAYLEKSIFDVLPGAVTKKVFTIDEQKNIKPVADEETTPFKIYACYTADDSLVGVAIEAREQGFQDVIRIIYGYAPAQEDIVGMKVLQSTETPGLGDKIEKDPDFLANFKNLDVSLADDRKSLKEPITMVKGEKTKDTQISAITGATISSRAITNMIAKSAELNIPTIKNNLDALKKDSGSK